MAHTVDNNNPLFVEDDIAAGTDSEESLSQFHEAEEEQSETEDDPIIDSIPLVLNNLPERSTQSLHLIQYVGRPLTRSLDSTDLKASVKKESQVFEVKVPLDTTTFYDQAKCDEWGVDVTENSLQGVFNSTDGGLYVGKIVGSGNERKFVLLPVDSTTQVRPSFQYLDEIDAAKSAQRKFDNTEGQKTNNIQILQTSAKVSTQGNNGEGFGSNALGESLKHRKKFEEEEWSHLTWRNSNDQSTKELESQLLHSANEIELRTDTTNDDYINLLIQS